MSIPHILQAWKDRNYQENLSLEQQAELPENPIGEDLSAEELDLISGGVRPKQPSTKVLKNCKPIGNGGLICDCTQ